MRPTSNAYELRTMRVLDDWHEDYGDVLWWIVPVSEAPYCGTPYDEDWPGYHTHWTPLPNVICPVQGPINQVDEAMRRAMEHKAMAQS